MLHRAKARKTKSADTQAYTLASCKADALDIVVKVEFQQPIRSLDRYRNTAEKLWHLRKSVSFHLQKINDLHGDMRIVDVIAACLANDLQQRHRLGHL